MNAFCYQLGDMLQAPFLYKVSGGNSNLELPSDEQIAR